MKTYQKGFWAVLALILLTGGAMAYVEARNGAGVRVNAPPTPAGDGLVSLQASMARTKVLVGSDGQTSLALTLSAATLPAADSGVDMPVEMVVVLDRSGSMNGQKINDACDAVIRLADRLTPRDRLSLVTYANDVRTDAYRMTMDGTSRNSIIEAVHQIRAGGGTNLGGGLQRGIQIMQSNPETGRQRKMILISDGLANQGITDPQTLARLAATAVAHGFSISSVGVGHDFNEVLMTSLADHGTGRYYFLENPQAFAQVFEDEFQSARQVAASGLELRIPLRNGIHLTHAGGYPIEHHDGFAVLHPGDLLSGQERQLFLTFRVPTDREAAIRFGDMQLRYRHQGKARTLNTDLDLAVACVTDSAEVAASVDEAVWTRQVLQEDFSRLKASVADAIRKGERASAEQQIEDYAAKTQEMNAVVGSAAVTLNLAADIPQLRESVKETFEGAPAAVAAKRKQKAKALQYDSYQIRRDQQK